MNREDGQRCMARLAAIDSRVAELDGERAQLGAERARIFLELAEGQSYDLRTQRAVPERHEPELPELDAVTQRRARQALQRTNSRRRLG